AAPGVDARAIAVDEHLPRLLVGRRCPEAAQQRRAGLRGRVVHESLLLGTGNLTETALCFHSPLYQLPAARTSSRWSPGFSPAESPAPAEAGTPTQPVPP